MASCFSCVERTNIKNVLKKSSVHIFLVTNLYWYLFLSKNTKREKTTETRLPEKLIFVLIIKIMSFPLEINKVKIRYCSFIAYISWKIFPSSYKMPTNFCSLCILWAVKEPIYRNF